MRGRTILISTFAVLAVVSVAVATAGAGDPRRTADVTPERAAEIARSIPGAPVGSRADVRGPIPGVYHNAYSVSYDDMEALVDVKTGGVISVAWPRRMPSTTEVSIGEDAATQAAESLLRGLSIEARGSRSVQVLDHGSVVEYVIEWRLTDAAGVRLPHHTVVRVNAATAEVFSVLHLERSYTPPAAAVVSREQAERIAREASGLAHVTDAFLHVRFDDLGTQRTAWRVNLVSSTSPDDYVSARSVLVDASTGETIAEP
jgi:hypothetical protein